MCCSQSERRVGRYVQHHLSTAGRGRGSPVHAGRKAPHLEGSLRSGGPPACHRPVLVRSDSKRAEPRSREPAWAESLVAHLALAHVPPTQPRLPRTDAAVLTLLRRRWCCDAAIPARYATPAPRLADRLATKAAPGLADGNCSLESGDLLVSGVFRRPFRPARWRPVGGGALARHGALGNASPLRSNRCFATTPARSALP